MFTGKQPFNPGRFRLEFQNCIFVPFNECGKNRAPLNDRIQGKAVCKFSCPDSEYLLAAPANNVADSFKFLFKIYEYSNGRLVKISLKNTIGAV